MFLQDSCIGFMFKVFEFYCRLSRYRSQSYYLNREFVVYIVWHHDVLFDLGLRRIKFLLGVFMFLMRSGKRHQIYKKNELEGNCPLFFRTYSIGYWRGFNIFEKITTPERETTNTAEHERGVVYVEIFPK